MFALQSYVTTIPQGQIYKRAIRQLTISKKEPAALFLECFSLGLCVNGSCTCAALPYQWNPQAPGSKYTPVAKQALQKRHVLQREEELGKESSRVSHSWATCWRKRMHGHWRQGGKVLFSSAVEVVGTHMSYWCLRSHIADSDRKLSFRYSAAQEALCSSLKE